MQAPRLTILMLVALLAVVVLSGWRLARRLMDTLPPQTTVDTATPTPLPEPTPTATVFRAPPGYRLAGVAAHNKQPYAVIEAPDGAHALYRLNDDVPGLGRLSRIGAERVLITSPKGELTLWVAPAATASPTQTRRAPTPTLKVTPRPTLAAGGTAPGSFPSSAPGRPAS